MWISYVHGLCKLLRYSEFLSWINFTTMFFFGNYLEIEFHPSLNK